MSDKKEWVMPDWMEPYRDLICNTGGNPIEELMNDTGTNIGNNAIRTALIIAVDTQVILLNRLHKKGLLIDESKILFRLVRFLDRFLF